MIYTHAAAALAALAIGFGGAWQVHEWRLGEEIADMRASHAQTLATAVQAARDQEKKRHAALQKEAEDARVREDAARADADAARDAGERLRNQLAVARSAACRSATTAAPGKATGAAPDLLADVQRRLDQAADGIAAFADLAHSAGIACERSAGAMRP